MIEGSEWHFNMQNREPQRNKEEVIRIYPLTHEAQRNTEEQVLIIFY
jgi:hypothetical protein